MMHYPAQPPVRIPAAGPHTHRWPHCMQVLINVRSVGLNFRDVLNVLGLYPGDPGDPGGDCAGTVAAVGSAAAAHHRWV